jgi:hypothetical protein
MRPPKPAAESTSESTSRWARRGVVTFRTFQAPSARLRSAIGRTTRNSQRQLSRERTRPDTVGPIAGATEMTIEMTPMIRPREPGATRLIAVVMSSGIITPVPPACTTRPSSSTPKPGAAAAISVPVLKSPIAATNTWRTLNRSMTNPVAGITTAIVSRKPVVSHWPVAAETFRSLISRGRASDITVSLKMTTKVEMTSRPMRLRSAGLSRCSVEGAVRGASAARVTGPA